MAKNFEFSVVKDLRIYFLGSIVFCRTSFGSSMIDSSVFAFSENSFLDVYRLMLRWRLNLNLSFTAILVVASHNIFADL